MQANSDFGALVGACRVMEYCRATGTLKGYRCVGDLAGRLGQQIRVDGDGMWGNLYRCSADANIRGHFMVGGFVGDAYVAQ